MAASLLVHAALGGIVAFAAFNATAPDSPTPLPAGLQVSLTTHNPQVRDVPAPPESTADVAGEVAGIAAPPAVSVAEISELPPQDAEDSADVAEDAASPIADTAPVSSDGPAGGDEDVAESPNAEPGLSPDQLKASVTSYVATWKSGLVQDWLTECQKFRNRYATRDCPTGTDADYAPHAEEKASTAGVFETWVTRPATNARISEQLVTESKYLAGLMDQPGVMGEIARQRYSMVRDQYCYLNPDVQGCAMVSVKSMVAKASDFARAGPASDVVFSINLGLSDLVAAGEDGKRHFLKGLFSVSKDGEVEFFDARRAPPALPFRYPPERNAPAPMTEEDTFEVAPPLFPLR